jgi:hypothetical protein
VNDLELIAKYVGTYDTSIEIPVPAVQQMLQEHKTIIASDTLTKTKECAITNIHKTLDQLQGDRTMIERLKAALAEAINAVELQA